MKQVLTFSVLFCLLSSCDHCRNEQVPAIQLYMEVQARQEKLIVKNRHVQRMLMPGHSVLLPFSLDADTTNFYFQDLRGVITNTLSISYTRKAVFEDGACGFYLSIDNPVLLPETTFDSVEIFTEGSFTNISIYE